VIVEAFYSHLKVNAGIKALCKRIFPDLIPQGQDTPAIVYSFNDDERQQHLSGLQGNYRMARFAVDCYDLNKGRAHTLADAVESALIGFRGTLGSTTPAIDADHIRLERRFDLYETDTKLHRTALEFTVGYE